MSGFNKAVKDEIPGMLVAGLPKQSLNARDDIETGPSILTRFFSMQIFLIIQYKFQPKAPCQTW